MNDPTALAVGVTVEADAAADDEETADLRGHMRSMLVEHEFEVAERPVDMLPPPGAKVGDPVSINSLLVTLAASGGVLTTLVGALQAWVLRSSARKVVVEIDGDRLEVNGSAAKSAESSPPPGSSGTRPRRIGAGRMTASAVALTGWPCWWRRRRRTTTLISPDWFPSRRTQPRWRRCSPPGVSATSRCPRWRTRRRRRSAR